MNLLIVKMMFCIYAGNKIIAFIELLPKCTMKMRTEKKKLYAGFLLKSCLF